MNSSAKQILIGWIYRRIGFLKRGMKKQIKPLAAILRFLDFSIPPIPSFRAQREIFLALRRSLLLSLKVSHFPLSHIRRYTDVQERSLHFGRDDNEGIAFYKHIRCTLRGINLFPPIPSFRAQREIFLALCSFLLPSQKVSHFPLSHIGRYTSVPERSLDFARDDVTEVAFSQHIRCTLHGIDSFPPRRHEGRSEKSSLHFVLSCSFRKRFPLFRYHTYDIIPSCKKDPSTSLGMTLREWRFPNISVVRYVK